LPAYATRQPPLSRPDPGLRPHSRSSSSTSGTRWWVVGLPRVELGIVERIVQNIVSRGDTEGRQQLAGRADAHARPLGRAVRSEPENLAATLGPPAGIRTSDQEALSGRCR